MKSEFQSRLLYTQSSVVQHESDNINVSSTIYAIRFVYPGATQHTTSRIRITCTYKDLDQFEAHAGVIERWSDKGWLFIDDYTGAVYAFMSKDSFRKRLLDYAHAFIMGIPLGMVDEEYIPDISFSPKSKKTKPDRIFEFDNKKNKTDTKINNVKKDIYKKKESKSDDDDDSDDFYL
jgi:hypothetical protein